VSVADVCTTRDNSWTEERDREVAARSANVDVVAREVSYPVEAQDAVAPYAWLGVGLRVDATAPPTPSDRDALADKKLEEVVNAIERGDIARVEALAVEGGAYERP
jgi:hypothetical protein